MTLTHLLSKNIREFARISCSFYCLVSSIIIDIIANILTIAFGINDFDPICFQKISGNLRVSLVF